MIVIEYTITTTSTYAIYIAEMRKDDHSGLIYGYTAAPASSWCNNKAGVMIRSGNHATSEKTWPVGTPHDTQRKEKERKGTMPGWVFFFLFNQQHHVSPASISHQPSFWNDELANTSPPEPITPAGNVVVATWKSVNQPASQMAGGVRTASPSRSFLALSSGEVYNSGCNLDISRTVTQSICDSEIVAWWMSRDPLNSLLTEHEGIQKGRRGLACINQSLSRVMHAIHEQWCMQDVCRVCSTVQAGQWWWLPNPQVALSRHLDSWIMDPRARLHAV
jgi:hypothetical protein